MYIFLLMIDFYTLNGKVFCVQYNAVFLIIIIEQMWKILQYLMAIFENLIHK